MADMNMVIANNISRYLERRQKKQVELAEGRKRYQASVLGVDKNGALRVRTQEGNQHSVLSGEIIISKNRRIS